MSEQKALGILERGLWSPDQLVAHSIVEREAVKLYPGDAEAIEANWNGILAKNPKAFAGPTVRLLGRHRLDDKLILEVAPSDYKEGYFLSFLGVAMVPVTTDGFIALQEPVASVAATIGGGTRVPGCTPSDSLIIGEVIRKMKKEFGAEVLPEHLSILGLIEARPPIAKFHHGLVVKVSMPCVKDQLAESWQGAEDKWQGNLEFLEMRRGLPTFGSASGSNYQKLNRQSLLILTMVIESELGGTLVNDWGNTLNWW